MAKRQRYQKQENGINLRSFHPKNADQDFYLKMLREETITFCTGPAGTGKTFITVYAALEALFTHQVSKIILTRPIVATEDIGYLPGDMHEKIHPYIMPLFDAVEMHVGPTKAKDLYAYGAIEVIPLAYMRGRSLPHAFLILDEAQNTTREQMKMFLTRMGEGSRVAVNGDSSQSDLPKGSDNGLCWAVDRLRGAESGISINNFTSRNIVRHPLIEKIIGLLGD